MKFKILIFALLMMIFTACSSTSTSEVETQKETEEVKSYDLTQMSSTMVYSQIFDLVTDPNKYLNSNFTVQGSLLNSEDANTGEMFYALLIVDATSCCAQGLELSFPEDMELPEMPMGATIVGTIGVKTVGDYDFPYVNVSEIIL